MAVELTAHPDDKTLEVRASGKLTRNDYEQFEPAVVDLIKQAGKIKILFVMHDFHGWDLGAVWDDIKFATRHCHDIQRIAMVGEKSWEKWMTSICKPFTKSSIKYFQAGELDAAKAWLS